MSIESDVQTLNPGNLIDLYEIDATQYNLDIIRYCAHVNEFNAPIVWNGHTYYAFPIVVDGFEKSSSGSLPRPVMSVSNVAGSIGRLMRMYNNLLGCKVTRIRTLTKYLDSVNFRAGNGTADPTVKFPDEVYFIDRVANMDPEVVQVELAVQWDITGVQLPFRQVIRDVCTWVYRGGDCGYAGPPVADVFDTPVTSYDLDRCSKHKTGCRLRFPEPQSLPAGFFPGVGVVR